VGKPDDAHGRTIVGDSAREAGGAIALLPRGANVGRYVILDHIGTGGMSVVYAAYDPQLDRKVAIKLLRASEGSEERQQRLLREAQAMARLSHPNVLAIHDVGTFGAGVFIATEFVDGPTLRQWQDVKGRSWRAVLAKYVEAGRGLASAHVAGLVHRDFKPQNVLIDAQGRARVLDFGLVRILSDMFGHDDAPGTDTAVPPSLHASGNLLQSPLTHMGAVMGTPAYMSPEQLNGDPVDARTDQFSFCVALYEALYGERPFCGETLEEVKRSVNAGLLRELPAHTRVPKRLRKILLRGLHRRPNRRYSSLDALLSALESPSKQRGWRVAVMGAAVALALVVLTIDVTLSARRARRVCVGADDKVAGAWSSARRRAVADAFAKSGSPVAAEVLGRVEAGLDRYAHHWVAAYTDSCEATHVRGEQSAELLDLRTQCLSTRLSELRATTELLAHADAKLVSEAPKTVAALSRIEDCADVEALKAPERLPRSPDAAQKIARIRDDVAAARVADVAGQFSVAVRDAERALLEARAAKAAQLEAEALYNLASARYHAGEGRAGIDVMIDAALAATGARDDKLAAAAWGRLVHYGAEAGRFDEASQWARLALVEGARAGSPPTVMADVYDEIGNLRAYQGRVDEAVALYRRAIDTARSIGNDGEMAMATNNLAGTLSESYGSSESLSLFRQAYEIWNRELGPAHPNTLMALENVAHELTLAGLYDDAERSMKRDLALRDRTLGADHPDNYWALGVLADVEMARGHFAKAEQLAERERQQIVKGYGERSPLLVDAYQQLGQVAVATHRAEQAKRDYEQAMALDKQNDTLRSAQIAYGLAQALQNLHDGTRAQKAIADARRLLRARTDKAAVALRKKLDAPTPSD
jgi:tetratricopeptide (TPR) repeat protein